MADDCKIITVNQMVARLLILRKNGCGESPIYLMTDEEGNSSRPLYDGMDAGTVDKDTAGYYGMPENAVVIG